MASKIKEIQKVLAEVRPELMAKQNVVATGIGYKRKAGKLTNKLCIKCSVEIKMSENRLGSGALIPSSIHNVVTDVDQTGVIRALQDSDPTGRFRPAPGGVSIGHFNITAGTLGCVVKKNDTLFILSNNHVMANSNAGDIGDAILQPGPADGGGQPDDEIARLSEFVPILFNEDDENGNTNGGCTTAGFFVSILNAMASSAGRKTRIKQYKPGFRAQATENKVDCAIAQPLNQEDIENEILEIGSIAGVAEGELGMELKKSGRTTGLTTGEIEQIDVTAQVNYGANRIATFTNQLVAGAMSQGGDSGSAVLNNDNNIVGLLFAGSNTTTVINRIQDVFEALDVSLP